MLEQLVCLKIQGLIKVTSCNDLRKRERHGSSLQLLVLVPNLREARLKFTIASLLGMTKHLVPVEINPASNAVNWDIGRKIVQKVVLVEVVKQLVGA